MKRGRALVLVWTLACLACAALLGCGPKQAEGPAVGLSTHEGIATPPSDREIVYAFDPLDDRRPVSSEANRGRPTVLAFVTTGDLVCQAQANYLEAMAKRDGDSVAYALVALHPRKEIVLVEAYADTLGLTYPTALAEPTATTASGPFGDIPAVPTVVILDRAGRLVWKHTGLAKADEIRAQLSRL